MAGHARALQEEQMFIIIYVTIGLLWSKQKVGHLLFCFKNNRPSTLLLWTFGPQTRPASESITQLPHQNWTIWVRNAWDFCPIFTSLIYVIIEPKIAPFPISRNCPTLRLASLDTAMAYPVFLQKLIWGHSHGQAFIEWITYFSFFPHEHMRPLHKTSHFFVYSKNHPLIKTTVCPRGGTWPNPP